MYTPDNVQLVNRVLMDTEKLYTISEVAEKLSLAPKTLRRWEEAGRFRAGRTIGNQRRYSIEDLQILDAIKHGTINNSDELLTIQQAASLFGVSVQTIERWENEGKIHPFITAGSTYYPRPKLLAKMHELTSSLTQEPEDFTVGDPLQNDLLPQEESAPEQLSPSLPPISSKERVESPQRTQLSRLNHPHSPDRTAFSSNQTQSQSNKSRPTPSRSSPLPSITLTTPSRLLFTALLLNAALTTLLLAGYHTLVSSTGNLSPTANQGQVKGQSSVANVLDQTLASILDTSGNLKTPGSISAQGALTLGKSLSFAPTSPPIPNPGTLYYDAGSETLKIYTRGAWYDFPGSTTLPLTNSVAKSGVGVVPSGKNSALVTDPSLTPETPVSLTFLGDYSPAKKYWLTLQEGSFTVHTDFPVSERSPFVYLILAEEPEEATGSGSPASQIE